MSNNQTSEEFLDEVLGKMGEAVAKNYESDPLKAWCTTHYFKLDEGVCIGCEAKQAILQHFQQEQETGEPRECLCQLCNKEYPVWFAPNDLWNRVMRVDGKEEHPFVCPICFAFKYEKEVDPKTVWMLAPQKGLVYSQSEVDRLIAETRLNLIEYFDQCSDNEKMNWKGLFEDTRKLAQSELDQLSKQEEGSREA